MRSGSFFWFGRMVATMNFGGRSIVAKAITLRFVVVLGRLDLELPWIFFADQVCWWSFGFLLLQWWWSATMDHKNGHWSIYRVFSIVESPNPKEKILEVTNELYSLHDKVEISWTSIYCGRFTVAWHKYYESDQYQKSKTIRCWKRLQGSISWYFVPL